MFSVTKKLLDQKMNKLIILFAFLLWCPACVMTRAQGDMLTNQVRHMEDEVAKLQRVRHDIEILMSGQVRDLFDRMAKLESQLSTLREAYYDGTNKSHELVSEIASLRGQLEEAQFQYKNLENDQKSLAHRQQALKNQVAIPPLKKDHFDLAKKLFAAQKYEPALSLFDEYIKQYENDKESKENKESIGQAYYSLGEIYRTWAETQKSSEESEKFYKKSVMSYQKVVEQKQSANLSEEALFKMGLVLKALGNTKAAQAAFNELLSNNKNSKRAIEAKKQLAGLKSE